ncbi:hypothetical protein AM587_10009339 [Phytophthora nicotianae]|uniref:Uncharacterized protein n=1 Tax=Phytophthora nicotianae TaxID=4792 RepID=A0A0W8BVG9_PHYNI|nr:hypothetical protein AM587_10009339 [Phytophthora nicotianae]
METERRRRRDEASSVPIAVREAIQAFVPDAGTKVLPARPSETSFVYNWGVRVISTSDESATAVWMCMASETCRTQRAKLLMSGGKTSKATQLPSKAHDIGSDKTASELGNKRTQALRIVNENLPFRIGEYAESLLLGDLMLKEEARVALNAKVIRHAAVELYDSTKRQVEVMLADNRIGVAKSFSIVADF